MTSPSDIVFVISGGILFLIMAAAFFSEEAIIAVPVFGVATGSAIVFGYQLGALGYFQ